MESISFKHVISAAHALFPLQYSVNPTRFRKIGSNHRHLSWVLHSKKWDLQDFQSYAKPRELLPASEVKIYRPFSVEEIIHLFELQKCDCLYKVKLETSRMYGSTLSNSNSGVLLCLIDENNNSILQRVPAFPEKDYSFDSKDDKESLEVLNFQRGCVDEFMFEGQTLGKIAAIWISIESGQWRFGNLSLTVFCRHQSPSAEADKGMHLIGYQYDFDVEDTLLGEGSDISMLELRPSLVTDFSGRGAHLMTDVKALYPSSSLVADTTISGEESMKEYADLKFSLFLYDAMLILAGSSIASISVGDKAALAFFSGGIGGFVYLLLLQRSVDGLPAPELVATNSSGKNSIFRGPLTIALAFLFAVIAGKCISAVELDRVLAPSDLIFGMMGFLMCKVSVLLAAFKPMHTGTKG